MKTNIKTFLFIFIVGLFATDSVAMEEKKFPTYADSGTLRIFKDEQNKTVRYISCETPGYFDSIAVEVHENKDGTGWIISYCDESKIKHKVSKNVSQKEITITDGQTLIVKDSFERLKVMFIKTDTEFRDIQMKPYLEKTYSWKKSYCSFYLPIETSSE